MALLRRASRDGDEEGQALEAALEVREPAERRAVGPVEIVDRDHRRAAQRDVGREPVEPVEHGERDVGLVLVGACQLHVLEERGRERRCPSEELRALVARRPREHRLEELAHDAVREVLLELAATRVEDDDAGLRRDPPRLCK